MTATLLELCSPCSPKSKTGSVSPLVCASAAGCPQMNSQAHRREGTPHK
eukprot:CAMPEP_0115715592 /NCGR_PEP_ID=MMETSP0272-20121206/75881_1 /TAXON_ID=71861 /ORGANISM="Scrippsiella trochoidea, Strain CCMP3099" /LENGTH=48 /DNA_ID= /DNA_START= /DNA_END= /DNA_ORIENTATION=